MYILKVTTQGKGLGKMKEFVRQEYLVQFKTVNLVKWLLG